MCLVMKKSNEDCNNQYESRALSIQYELLGRENGELGFAQITVEAESRKRAREQTQRVCGHSVREQRRV